MDLLAFVLAAMARLQPEANAADHARLADAIAVAAEERPEVAGDVKRTAALLVATAYAETRFDHLAIGDSGRSCSAFALWIGRSIARCRALQEDIYGAARIALERLAESIHVCRAQPPGDRLALYLGGACDTGLRQSRWRWWLAGHLARVVRAEGAAS